MGVRDFTLTPFFILIQQKAPTIDGEMNAQMVLFDSGVSPSGCHRF